MPPATSIGWIRCVTSRRMLTQPSAKIHPKLIQLSRLYASETTKAERTVESTESSEQKKQAQQNRHKIDRQSYEYSQSGTDDAVASQSVAFENKSTDPEALREASGKENNWSNPLHASPANQSMSAQTVEVRGDETTPTKSVSKEKGMSRSEPTTKSGKPGAEKQAFAGSTKAAKEKRVPMVEQGVR
ncbi:hypothetical protein LTR10_016227 [Elasticomyces elasticus]|uniref:Uncharacterized protein n=1 Tax=Exophiala sideris TaxID=1016849 RepID=A0ABR0JN92_9EURO|nr:hypothetical protein LTR10_016227 [Elasticomyces elasticus]KAK5037941.1 hypothetical protein LTS07_001408 [Exophiala sideris]KAK5043924.1 hypothetical protein LTR13_000278 [Exophiala sideris]KAK5067423.1 hypothetical protein LTR69_001410 [Exophiala sideris]KAK5182756.1 hypothetical protein LTR44_005147 [Eurotiomycetes sp. CCFEE 6388]